MLLNYFKLFDNCVELSRVFYHVRENFCEFFEWNKPLELFARRDTWLWLI